jgi:hypothetical protein
MSLNKATTFDCSLIWLVLSLEQYIFKVHGSAWWLKAQLVPKNINLSISLREQDPNDAVSFIKAAEEIGQH